MAKTRLKDEARRLHRYPIYQCTMIRTRSMGDKKYIQDGDERVKLGIAQTKG